MMGEYYGDYIYNNYFMVIYINDINKKMWWKRKFIIYSNIKMNKNNTSNKNDNIKEVFDYKDKK